MIYQIISNHILIFKKIINQVIDKFIQSPVAKNFIIYSFGTIVLRGISFLFAPIILSLMNPADYGILSLINSFINIFVIFIGLGLRQVFSLEYFHCDSDKRKIMVNDIISIYMIVSLPIIFIGLFYSSRINSVFFCNMINRLTLYGIFLYCFIYFFSELFYQILQYQIKALKLTILQTSTAVMTILLNFIFVYFYGWGIFGMIFGYLFGIMMTFIWALKAYLEKDCLNQFNLRRSLKNFFYYIKLGLPFIPGVLFGWILASGDRWMLARYATLNDVGIYSVADMFRAIYHMLIIYPMSSAYLPFLFQKYAENKHDLKSVEQWNRKNMYISMLASFLIITFGFIVFKPIIFWVLPKDYGESVQYIWGILFGNIFLMGTYFASGIIQFFKKSYFLVSSMSVAALMNMLLNYVLIPYFNIYGCIAATIIAYMFHFALLNWYSQKLCRHLD